MGRTDAAIQEGVTVMERDDPVIELAIASEETKGPGGLAIDEQQGQNVLGIVED